MATRLAIINRDRCKPKKCNHECKRSCPQNQMGRECVSIEETPTLAAKISEELCIGCGMCVKACPFKAITIVKLPSEIPSEKVFRYGENSFRLYRLPLLNQGEVLGLLGQNGIGKSTVLGLLCGSLRPNFDNPEKPLTDKEIITTFRGTSLQKYFQSLYGKKLKIVSKIQQIEMIKQKMELSSPETTTGQYLEKVKDKEYRDYLIERLELGHLLETKVHQLSGGELQRLICGVTAGQEADVYIFDEPSNYLDVKQRLRMAQVIRSRGTLPGKYCIVVEHDIAILDLVSDRVCLMYGQPGAYGVVSKPMVTARGINSFFRGFIRSENIRIREEAYQFKLGVSQERHETLTLEYEDDTESRTKTKTETTIKTTEKQKSKSDSSLIRYPAFEYNHPKSSFTLKAKAGSFSSQACITVLLGRNGTGKSTFLTQLTKRLDLVMSVKPQHPNIRRHKKDGVYPTVEKFIHRYIKKKYYEEMFQADVVRPFRIKTLMEKRLNELSGGELQRVVTTLALGVDADLYLIDEPSANLDVEQRAIMTRVLKRFLIRNNKPGFIVEHDMLMAMSLGSEDQAQIIVFEENHAEKMRIGSASSPQPFEGGINCFLKQMNITFRSDPENKRPRINRIGSRRDQEQKKTGQYFTA